MRIVGILSWYDESPSWLSTAVSGFARLCDEIVAVDGAYALYPQARGRSHPNQVEAIQQAAEAQGRGCLVYQPSDVWRENEVGKRNKCLDLAGTLEPDWVLIFDADYHVLHMNPEAIRYELATTELPVATYGLLETQDFVASPDVERMAHASPMPHEWTTTTRDVYRWDPELRVGPAHWHYTIGDLQLRGPWAEVDALDLSHDLTVYHRNTDRALARRQPKERYHKLVDQLGIESELVHG